MNNDMLSLHLFEQEGEEGGAACESAADKTAPVQETPQNDTVPESRNEEPLEDRRRAEFERLIKGEFRDLYDECVRNAINRRFRSHAPKEGDLSEKWLGEEAEVKQLYPNFSMMKTVLDPKDGRKFMAMLAAGFTVRDAYEALNKNEIIGTLMRYTAERIREKTLNDIRLRGLRPEENGAASAAARFTKSDPSTWSDEEMDRVVERVRRGERIVL